jgi:predicted nucleic acid-binding protein
VYGELLIGDKGGRTELLANYERMDQAPLVSHAEVVAFVRHRKLNGRGIGWIDAHLLASALVGRLRLWTVDSPLAIVSTELGIAYE